jgi:hypothetical protein
MRKKTKLSNLPRQGKDVIVTSLPPLPRTSITKPDILAKRPTWRFRRMDWRFSAEQLKAKTCSSGPRLSSNDVKVECCLHTLSDRLKSYETMTWGEIINQDRNGSHFISMDKLELSNPALHGKFMKLLTDGCVDEPFSLRLGSLSRIWGIILSDGTFEAICYDPLHSGWPTNKS